MKTSRILIVSLLLIANLTTAQSRDFGSIDYNKAINISGKQRMLSQKMAKAYLLMSKGVNNDKIKKELNSSKFIFEKQLEILSRNSKSSSTKLYIKNVYKLWDKFKGVINEKPSLVNSIKIMELNTNLLSACHQLVQNIESISNYDNKFFSNNDQGLVNTINVSGKQRMLSQRLCLYFTAIKVFPKNKKEYQVVLEKVFEEFSTVIGDLLINSYNTTSIEEEIGFVMTIWEKYRSNKRKFLDGDFELIDVYGNTNDMTTSFNLITGSYEIISKHHQ